MKTKAILASLFSLALLSGISAGGPVPDFPFIHASGRATREVAPTNAKIEFSVLAFSKNPEDATNTVQTSLAKLLASLKELGVKDDQVQAHDFEKSAARTRPENSFQATEILGYEVSRKVLLKLPELSNYPKIVRTLMETEHVTGLDSSFYTDKREDVEAELASEACGKARKKADLLAKGAGVTISGVHAVGEPDITSLGDHYGFSPRYGAEASYGAAEREAPVFVPARIEITTFVSILFNLSPYK